MNWWLNLKPTQVPLVTAHFHFRSLASWRTSSGDTGADIVRVPFRGGSDLVNAMLAGSTQVGLFGLSNMLSQLQAGLLTLVAVNSKERSPLFPDVPTFVELGRGDYPPSWFGLFAPNETPNVIVHKLGDEV